MPLKSSYPKFHLHVHQREFILIVSKRETANPVLNVLVYQYNCQAIFSHVNYRADYVCLLSVNWHQMIVTEVWKSVESNKNQFQWFLARHCLSLSICEQYTKRLCLLNWLPLSCIVFSTVCYLLSMCRDWQHTRYLPYVVFKLMDQWKVTYIHVHACKHARAYVYIHNVNMHTYIYIYTDKYTWK